MQNMKAMVVYDTNQGNTEKIAQAVAAGLSGGAAAFRVGSTESKRLQGVDLLVLGSPTIGGRPTEAMQKYMNGLPLEAAETLTVATFDTRLKTRFVKVFGYAADRMAAAMKDRAKALRSKPEASIVLGRNGPLAEGEMERATAWGKQIQNE